MNHFLSNSDGTSLETDRSCASKVSSLDAGPLSITFDHENLSVDGLTLNSADFEIEPDTNLAEEILSDHLPGVLVACRPGMTALLLFDL